MMKLRAYQAVLKQDVTNAWAQGAKVVFAALATGGGKTPMFSEILREEQGASAAIAHRKELVSQMSLTLARNAVRHRVIGPKDLIRNIVTMHIQDTGSSYYDPHARCGVVGIDSLPSLHSSDPWLSQVRTWVGDEGHHFLRENKWGRGVAMFPNARGLLVSATGFRADGNGLGRGHRNEHGQWSNDGLADALVQGPPMRWLIEQGYLTDYRVIAPPSDIDYSDVPVTASGELSPQKLREAVHRSTRIVGDVVKTYLKFTPNTLAIVFAVDVEEAGKLAKGFRDHGVIAEVVSAKTPDLLRYNILQQFRRRQVMVLVNVDLFGEGFDLPAVETVIMVRKTESKGLFDQQFGRGLRVMLGRNDFEARWDSESPEWRLSAIAGSPKPRATIIDHVGNIERHLPPDAVRIHTLARRDRRARKQPDDAIPLRTCLNPECWRSYERIHAACPFCGLKPEPVGRGEPKYVDGDLFELAPEVLAQMRGEVARIDAAVLIPVSANELAAAGIKNRHLERQAAQRELRPAIALWAGRERDLGRDLSESYRRFFFRFGIDVMSAQALGARDAYELRDRIREKLAVDGIVEAS